MKVIIHENERGLLYRDGRLHAWLEPGKSTFWPLFQSLRVEVLDLNEAVRAHTPELEELAPSDAFEPLRVDAESIAVVSIDGQPDRVLCPGRFLLWQLRAPVTAEKFKTRLLLDVPERLWPLLPPDKTRLISVPPYAKALVYDGGRLAHKLDEGRYALWTEGRDVQVYSIDQRETERTIAGQEVMTADKVTLRANIILKYKILDPVLAHQSVESISDALYSEAQMAARAYIGGVRLDALLEDRRAAGEHMRAQLADRALSWGVQVTRVDLKDLILPGEMRALLNQVIEAEKQAAANLILRREETAATRSLANTARMMDNNPSLRKLKELEALKEMAKEVGQVTVVAGANDLMNSVLLRNGGA